MMTENINYPLLNEYPFESNFLKLIPARAQRGLYTFDLEFTCLDVDGPYMAIGSNVGVVYLFNREKGCMRKLKDNEHRSPITSVKVLISLECLVAIGFREGLVVVYKVPFQEEVELEKFTVEGLHECAITVLEWAKNGMKLFSGDESGVVVCTEIDHFEHQSRSRLLLNEKAKIVQLSYRHLNLVISTLFRSVIYSMKTTSIYKIGQKERKCFGPFGALIFEDEVNSTIFVSRPGQRLWKSDMSGVIQETMMFKNALMTSYPTIKTNEKSNENPCFTDFQFERLARYESYILIWCDAYILLIDPIQKLIVATSPKLDPIIDVATCNNEIFILREMRHLIRISTKPDAYNNVKVIEEPSLFEEIFVPFKELSTYVKGHSDSLSVQKVESNPTIFNWLKKKRSTSTPANFSDDIMKQNKVDDVYEHLPEIVNINTDDCIPIKIDEFSAAVDNISPIITQDLSMINDSDDIVFKVKKKHRKNKKVQFDVDADPQKGKFTSDKNSEQSDKIMQPDKIIENDEYLNSENFQKQDKSIEFPKVLKRNDNNETELSVQNNSEPVSTDMNTVEKSNDSHVNILDAYDNTNCTDTAITKSVSGMKFVENNDVNPDKLLEDVLNAYSQFKHKDSSIDNSKDSQNVCDNNQNEIVNLNENNHSNLTVNIESVTRNINLDNLVDEKFPDGDEIYKSLDTKYSDCQEKNTNISENSVDSLEKLSLNSLDSKRDELPKYGVNWVQYRAPEILLNLSVSNDHIFCVDVRNQLYFSKLPNLGSLTWIQLEQPAEKIAVSDSENVVWVLYKGTIYAVRQMGSSLWENTEWISIARDVISIAVDDTCGWYVKSNGELITQQNLTAIKACNYPTTVTCNSPALQVSVKNGVLWVLTLAGSLITAKVMDGKKLKWKEIKLENIPEIDSIFLGSHKTGWIIDSTGMIYFIIGVTPETPDGTGKPWIVESSNYLFQPTSQLEQVVRKALSSETLTNLIRGKQHLCLSTSDTGVWFCKTYDNLLFSNQRNIIGHLWELIIPPNTAAATKWSLLAACGINNSNGSLWCVNSSGELFCYDLKSHILVPVELPSASRICCLQPNYESLWLLSEDGVIHVRRGITSNCPEGIFWQALDLLQLDSQRIIHISCSSFVSWACTETGDVLMRLGYLNPSSSKLNQAWISIGPANEEATSPLVKLSAIGKHFPLPILPNNLFEGDFCKVYVGPLGYPVWAVDRRANVYVREGVNSSFPIGNKWSSVPDLLAKDLCITCDAVWLLESSGKIYRRFGVTEKNLGGDYWKQIPGNLDCLSATEDDDLWGIQNGSMFCHFSFALYNAPNTNRKCPTHMTISEDDWEDIMAEDLDDDI